VIYGNKSAYECGSVVFGEAAWNVKESPEKCEVEDDCSWQLLRLNYQVSYLRIKY